MYNEEHAKQFAKHQTSHGKYKVEFFGRGWHYQMQDHPVLGVAPWVGPFPTKEAAVQEIEAMLKTNGNE